MNLGEIIFRLLVFEGRQALYTPPQVVDKEFKLKPYPMGIDSNNSSHPGFTNPGYMGLIVNGDKKFK
jgi:hypothetical protein